MVGGAVYSEEGQRLWDYELSRTARERIFRHGLSDAQTHSFLLLNDDIKKNRSTQIILNRQKVEK